MTIENDISLIRARFLAEFPSDIQRVMDNQPNEAIDEKQPYVRFGVNPNDTERTTYGTDGNLARFGLVWLQVFVPLQKGTKGAYQIVDSFADVFRNWRSTDADLWCNTERVKQVPNSEAFQLLVSIPYQSNS